MLTNQKPTGMSSGIPGGLALGVLAAMVLTVLLGCLLAILIGRKRLTQPSRRKHHRAMGKWGK